MQLQGIKGVLWFIGAVQINWILPTQYLYPFSDQTLRIQAIFLGENILVILISGTIYRQKKGSLLLKNGSLTFFTVFFIFSHMVNTKRSHWETCATLFWHMRLSSGPVWFGYRETIIFFLNFTLTSKRQVIHKCHTWKLISIRSNVNPV